MAQLTEKEQRQFQARGLWVRERCDAEGCRNAIGVLAWHGRNGVYCSEPCRDMSEGTPTRHRKPRQTLAEVEAAGCGTFIQRLMQKDPGKAWARKTLIRECKQVGLGTKKEIRKGLRQLEADGILLLDGKALRLANPAQAANGNRNGSTQAGSAEGQRRKGLGKGRRAGRVVEVEECPVAEEVSNGRRRRVRRKRA